MKAQISSLCSPLMDILVQVDDQFIADLGAAKGSMALADHETQSKVMKSVQKKSHTTEIGGTCLNVHRILGELGARASYLGALGDDEIGGRISERMKGLKIEDHTKTYSGVSSGTSFVMVTPDGERTMMTHLGAAAKMSAADVDFDAIENSEIFHCSGYLWTIESHREAVYQAIAHAKKHKVTVSLDLADPFVVDGYRDDLLKVIEKDVDILFANEQEANMLFHESTEKTADKLRSMVDIGVLKLGAKGAWIVHGEETIKIEAAPTDVVDTTGAGDSFAAGFLYGYMNQRSLKKSGDQGALIAADVISRIGVSVDDEVLKQVR